MHRPSCERLRRPRPRHKPKVGAYQCRECAKIYPGLLALWTHRAEHVAPPLENGNERR